MLVFVPCKGKTGRTHKTRATSPLWQRSCSALGRFLSLPHLPAHATPLPSTLHHTQTSSLPPLFKPSMMGILLFLALVATTSTTTLGFIVPAARPIASPVRTLATAVAAAPSAVVVETFILPMGDDSRLKIRCEPETFKDLALRVNGLLASFRNIKAANAAEDKKGPAPREPSLEFLAKNFETHLEMECNPNIYPDAFHATVFVKVKNDVLEVSSQCQLSALVDALKLYKQTYKVEIEASNAGPSK